MSDPIITNILRSEIPELAEKPEYIGQFFVEGEEVLYLPFKDAEQFDAALVVLADSTTGIAIIWCMEETSSAIHRGRFKFATATRYSEWLKQAQITAEQDLL